MEPHFDRVIDRRAAANLSKWTWYPEDVLPMWLADMDFAAPPQIPEALRAALAHDVSG